MMLWDEYKQDLILLNSFWSFDILQSFESSAYADFPNKRKNL